MSTKLGGRYEPANDCLRNQTTGVGLVIGKRRKPSHNKPPLYLLQVFEDGSQKYVSSLYMACPDSRTDMYCNDYIEHYLFDWQGVNYRLDFNIKTFTMEVVEVKNRGKSAGWNQSVSSDIITDLGAIFAPPYGAKVAQNHNGNQTPMRGGFENRRTENRRTERGRKW